MWVDPCQNLYCGLGLSRLDEPVFVAALLFRLTNMGYLEKFLTPCGSWWPWYVEKCTVVPIIHPEEVCLPPQHSEMDALHPDRTCFLEPSVTYLSFLAYLGCGIFFDGLKNWIRRIIRINYQFLHKSSSLYLCGCCQRPVGEGQKCVKTRLAASLVAP